MFAYSVGRQRVRVGPALGALRPEELGVVGLVPRRPPVDRDGLLGGDVAERPDERAVRVEVRPAVRAAARDAAAQRPLRGAVEGDDDLPAAVGLLALVDRAQDRADAGGLRARRGAAQAAVRGRVPVRRGVGLWLQAPPVDHQPVVRRLERRGAVARGLERGRDLRGRDERGVALRQPGDEPARVRRGSGRLRPRRCRGRGARAARHRPPETRTTTTTMTTARRSAPPPRRRDLRLRRPVPRQRRGTTSRSRRPRRRSGC